MKRFTTQPVEEDLGSYYYGGLHPVCLGDKFKDGRYRVVHKLGFGGFSSVLAVRDTHRDNRWAALENSES
ncbi:kinase dsk1 [Cordyceps militaris]|uniref:non-specific serine/threonine protein kinase n=1 Tax=Cordyceps militaris TaxID=73501 RepID=A0A2H4SCW0_CORMI|nr:kinase dsk1 [Cordyceps militaris]